MKRVIVGCMLAGLIAAGSADAQTKTAITECAVIGTQVVYADYNPITRQATVMFTHSRVGEVEGTGFYVPAKDMFLNPAQARLAAIRAAKDDAYAKLAERLCGVSAKKQK